MNFKNTLDATGVFAVRLAPIAVALAFAAGCSTYDMVIEVRYLATQTPVADAEIVITYVRMLSLKPEVAPLHFRADAAGRLAMQFDFREPFFDVRRNLRSCRCAGIAPKARASPHAP